MLCSIRNRWSRVRATQFAAIACLVGSICRCGLAETGISPHRVTLNRKADGYRGVWYMNEPLDSEYKYKYSGGLGTYCDYHQPFAVYRPEVKKTFFCYGGAPADNSRKLLHMVSYYDHVRGMVPRPTLLLDKKTGDAHDNPVISVDKEGYLWIFSTSHGRGRPSYIHRSTKPYDIEEFQQVPAVRLDGDREVPLDNFSYYQAWYEPQHGFICPFTRYHYPVTRTACLMTSRDGIHWSDFQRLGAIEEGHYQVSAYGQGKLATMMNHHPKKLGLNWRTNLYYLESSDLGKTWQTADGRPVSVPLTSTDTPALVRDYAAEKLNVYIHDLQLDSAGNPVLLYLTSPGFESGPKNDPRTMTLARWNGHRWLFHPIAQTDNNYDSGSLYLEADDQWRLIAPLIDGPQRYNTGGEMAMWTSTDQGANWTLVRQLTVNSPRNHCFARRPVNAHPGFYAMWADGNARAPSESYLYFCTQDGTVYQLPRTMNNDFETPAKLTAAPANPASSKRKPQ